MEYSIGGFSALTGLSAHTLRYYEQEGLIMPARNQTGRRRYSESDLAWIEFIRRLKDTGMPIKDICRYAQLRAQGDSTLPERMEMLTAHMERLSGQISFLLDHMAKLEEKIEFYRGELARLRE